MTCHYGWLLLVVLLHFWQVHGAGVNIHLIYLARVTSDLNKEYEPWLRAGTYFPDALYSCKPNKAWHDFAEAAHWPQFLLRAIKLWHIKYENDLISEDSLRLRNFLVGIFVHQVVDSSWHSLVDGYRSHGLLKVLAQTEFDGHTDEAHTFLDFMGDFIGLGNVDRKPNIEDMMFFTGVEWSLPKENDMLDLLKCAGADSINITYADLKVCMQTGFSGFVGELFSFLEHRSQILNTAYKISPRAREMIQDHWIGGEFNLIALLQNCLPTLNNLLDSTETPNVMEGIQLCGNLPLASNSRSFASTTVTLKRGQRDRLTEISTGHALSNFGSNMAIGKFKDDDQVYLAIGAPLENSQGSVYLIAWDKVSNRVTFEPETTSEPVTTMLGSDIHAYQLDGEDYLLISEPRTNSIYFYHAGVMVLKMLVTSGDESNQMKLTNVFYDECNLPGLLISSAYYGKYETGCLIIISGKDAAPLLQSSAEPRTAALSEISHIKLEGGSWSKRYQHYGSAVEWSPSYLYVACQSLGLVLVYSSSDLKSDSRATFVLKEKEVIPADEEFLHNSQIISSQTHGMFGKVICSFEYQGKRYVAISQHIFSTIFIYQETAASLKFYLKLKLPTQFTSTPYSVGFGTDVTYSRQFEALYASSPGAFNGKGAIWRITLNEIVKTSETWRIGILLINRKHLVADNRDSDQKGICNFGRNMLLGPNDRLVIGAPQYNYGNLQENQLTGMVFIL